MHTSLPVLTDADLDAVDATLADVDRRLETSYPGQASARQPVHTVYLAADTFHASTVRQWGESALSAARTAGGVDGVCALLGLSSSVADQIASRVEMKLTSEPIEDLRLDFEDGYGDRGANEDLDAVTAARSLGTAILAGEAPGFFGLRFKSLEAPTRRRGLRTLDLFLSELLHGGELPGGLVLTLPKVSDVAQVTTMVQVCQRLEEAYGLAPGRLRFEVQVETPQLIMAADGTVPVAQLLHCSDGRVSALHYGTYDYSDALHIAPGHQSMEHPAADYAKHVMQVAAAGTNVRLSDGSTNVLPVGSSAEITAAWRLHARLVRRSLEHGFYQGWDLHPAQLVTRFISTYAFYREGFAPAVTRLCNYLEAADSGILDEPATARPLARFVQRGVQCGAIDEAEVEGECGMPASALEAALRPPTTLEA